MRFFRSEEILRRWQADTANAGGEFLSLAQIWALSKQWYHNRLSPSYHGRTLTEIETIFRSLGFTAPFWYASES